MPETAESVIVRIREKGRLIAACGRCAMVAAVFALIIVAGQSSVRGFDVDGLPAIEADGNGTDGTYASLDREQKRLVDAWFRDYNRVAGESLDPKTEYENLAMSVRTTFEAVTNALIKTTLVSPEGKRLGSAIDLLDSIEKVRGKVPNAGGDEQFRIYAILKADAVSKLRASETFEHDSNNKFFHKGYPLNFRLKDAKPSIQLSISEDEEHADIDVDYRSSSFPASLFNGHLTAGNSDVRAGENYDRHIARWAGLAPWWESVFGIGGTGADSVSVIGSSDLISIPRTPARKEKKIENAARDFLKSWLVERQPGNATAYFSDISFPCVSEAPGKARRTINEGLVPVYLYHALEKDSKALGRMTDLTNAIESAELDVEGLKVVTHKYQAEFSVYKVPEDLAFEFDCSNRYSLDEQSNKKMPGRKYGKYYGVTFKVKNSGKARGSNLYLLFKKESGYWKIVSWEVEPDSVKGRRDLDASSGRTPEIKAVKEMKGPETLIAETKSFLTDWLIKRDIEGAMSFVSRRSNPCVAIYSRQDADGNSALEDERARISAGLQRFAQVLGQKKTLSAMIKEVTINSDELVIVDHPERAAYTLFSVPGELAASFECANRLAGDPRGPSVTTDGEYYGTSFRVNDNATWSILKLLWQQEEGKWKIVSYSVELP